MKYNGHKDCSMKIKKKKKQRRGTGGKKYVQQICRVELNAHKLVPETVFDPFG